jgi:cytolethal distending toxin subunit A
MTGGIFINYRRDDAFGTAGRLRDHLVRDRRSNGVFMDVDNIPAGVDFVDYLNGQLAACEVLLAVIGPHWLHAKDATGQRRLDDPVDYVRMEIAAALNRKIRVVPVLVDGARVPKPDDLPEDIKALARRNAIELRNDRFSRDVDALADGILGDRKPTWTRRTALTSGVAALVVLLAGWIGLHALGVAVPWPWPARLRTLAEHKLMLVNFRTGECLTIAGGVVLDNNVDAAQVACDGEPVRRWWLEETSVADLYQIKNVATGRCLTIAGGVSPANYVRALQYECDADPSRTWTITDAGGGLYEIRNKQTRKCLSLSDRDNPENSVRAGAPVQYECDADPSSRWTLVK